MDGLGGDPASCAMKGDGGEAALLSFPSLLSSLLSPLDTIANGWGGVPALDVSASYTLALYHRLTNLSLFDVHVSTTQKPPSLH